MGRARYEFDAEVWEQPSTGAWHFVSLPEAEADEIEETFGRTARGFGSIKVTVTIGSSQWSTSLFPDNKRRTYVLPVKKAVRIAEGLSAGSRVCVAIVVE
jgi:hypothetical protein